MLEVLSFNERCTNIEVAVTRKLKVTVGAEAFACIRAFPHAWFPALGCTLAQSGLFLRVCWFKALIGGWTTSDRLQLDLRWKCVFGCIDCDDEIRHYFVCRVLWQFARETLHIREQSGLLEERLCIVSPSIDKLRLLAFCHCLYHAVRNDDVCIVNGTLASPQIVQYRALALARHARFLVNNSCSASQLSHVCAQLPIGLIADQPPLA